MKGFFNDGQTFKQLRSSNFDQTWRFIVGGLLVHSKREGKMKVADYSNLSNHFRIALLLTMGYQATTGLFLPIKESINSSYSVEGGSEVI